MILGASQREHVVDALRHDRLDLLRDRPAMIDHMVSTPSRVTRLAFRGSRRNNGEPDQFFDQNPSRDPSFMTYTAFPNTFRRSVLAANASLAAGAL
jgi:hypothetical protein